MDSPVLIPADTQKPQIIKVAELVPDRLEKDLFGHQLAVAMELLGVNENVDNIVDFFLKHLLDPNTVSDFFNQKLQVKGVRCLVMGGIEERLLIFHHKDGDSVLLSFGRPLSSIEFPQDLFDFTCMKQVSPYLVQTSIPEASIDYVDTPRVVLCGLYLKDMFPLPRFALGISDIARALRRAFVANVKLLDMQLGLSVSQMVNYVIAYKPTIIGVSVTFGQQNMLSEFMQLLESSAADLKPLIVLGGSLSARNKSELLEQYPRAFISLGAGEKTMVDIVNFTRNSHLKNKIEGVCYKNKNEVIQTQKASNRLGTEMLPDLDLLEDTLDRGGVLLLETSRGCSYACSFCPRDHKGIWAGDASNAIGTLLPYISEKYDQRPELERKIYLVDEEMFGYNELSDNRVMELAESLQRYKFSFETSSRIDQVCRPRNSDKWHAERLRVWRTLVSRGLERCLFGVESGVDSILQRFNKKTKVEQNVNALRLLSAASIKVRCTYITFDNLMSFEELVDTYRFLGRKDIFLKSMDGKTEAEIVDNVLKCELPDECFAGIPFYSEVSYMLVSMEPLKGSKYAEMVMEAGLVFGDNMTMGRYESGYLDKTVGLFSEYCQMWVDRNFPLDYALKSIQKYNSPDVGKTISLLRKTLKRYAYELLGQLLYLESEDEVLIPDTLSEARREAIQSKLNSWRDSQNNIERKSIVITDVMNLHFSSLVTRFTKDLQGVLHLLCHRDREIIVEQMNKWKDKKSWGLYYA